MTVLAPPSLLQKPQPWNWSLGMLSPKGRAFAQKAHKIVPMWGPEPYDVLRKQHLSMTGWSGFMDTEWGRFVNFDGSTSYVNIADQTFGALVTAGQAQTFVFQSRSSGTGQFLAGSVDDGTSHIVQCGIHIHGDTGANNAGWLSHYWREVTGGENRAVSAESAGVDIQHPHIATFLTHESTADYDYTAIVLDGKVLTLTVHDSGTPDNEGVWDYPYTIGARNNRGTIDTFFDGGIGLYVHHVNYDGVEPLLNDIIELHADPWALIRPERRRVMLVPAAPPAGANPKGPLGMPLFGPFGGPI